MKDNKLIWIVIVLVALLFIVGFGGNIFVDKVANRVIQKLQKDYSPSPYGPGINPDRIDPDAIRKGTSNSPWERVPPQKVTEEWNESWEKQRQ